MSIQTLKDRLPDYAKDLKLNLGSLAAETMLNDTLKAGTFVAAAFASRNPEVIAAVNAEFGGKLAPADFTAAKAALRFIVRRKVGESHRTGGLADTVVDVDDLLGSNPATVRLA